MTLKIRRVTRTHIISNRWHRCFVCSLPTRAVEMDFEAPLHRWPCTRIMWRRYRRAVEGGER